MSSPESPPEKVSRIPVIAAGALAAVIMVVIALSWLVGEDPGEAARRTAESPSTSPTSAAGAPTTLRVPPPSKVRCLPPTPELLRGAEVAFDGDVVARDGDEARISVRRWYAGGSADEVTVVQRELPSTLGSWFELRAGERYLVSAEAGTVLVCGFSGPWSPQGERLFEAAFGS